MCVCVCVCVCLFVCMWLQVISHFHTQISTLYVCVCVNVRKEKMPTEENEPARWTKGRVSKSLMSPKPDR